MTQLNKLNILVIIFLLMVSNVFALTPPPDLADGGQDFRINSILMPNNQFEVTEGDILLVNVNAENKGASGDMYIEVGIYEASKVTAWGESITPLAILSSSIVNNCVPTETNVATKRVNIGSGMSGTTDRPFVIYVPKVGNRNDMVVRASSFLRCWDYTKTTGVTSTLNKPLTIKESIFVPTLPTCTDGIQNQDETWIDCGGNFCKPCRDGSVCLANRDCQSTNCFERQCLPLGNAGWTNTAYCISNNVYRDWKTSIGEIEQKLLDTCDSSERCTSGICQKVITRECTVSISDPFCRDQNVYTRQRQPDCSETNVLKQKCETGCNNAQCVGTDKLEPQKLMKVGIPAIGLGTGAVLIYMGQPWIGGAIILVSILPFFIFG